MDPIEFICGSLEIFFMISCIFNLWIFTMKCESGMQYIPVFFIYIKNNKKIYVLLLIQILLVYLLALESGISCLFVLCNIYQRQN